MSTEVVETKTDVQVVEPREGLFSKNNRKILADPLDDNNPITVQVLGICSALAVSGKVYNALVMTIAVIFVLALANLTISLLRKGIPNQIRMIVQLVVIATLVTVVREVLHAFAFSAYTELSVYVGLIITNCIIMGRLEAFAMANKPWKALLDGIGNGVGYGAILILVAVVRELFGAGELFGFPVFEKIGIANYPTNGILLVPVSAMFLIGIFVWIHRSWNKSLVDVS